MLRQNHQDEKEVLWKNEACNAIGADLPLGGHGMRSFISFKEEHKKWQV
jgi:hypothetical protein